MFAGVVLIWAYFALPETRPDHITGGGLRFIVRESRELFSNRIFLGYVLVCAIGTATFFAFLGGGPHVVIGIMGRTSAEYGLWFILDIRRLHVRQFHHRAVLAALWHRRDGRNSD